MLVGRAAAADDHEVGNFDVGTTISGGDSEYAGVSFNLAPNAASGLTLGFSADSGHYHYDSGLSRIHATYEGAGVQIGVHSSGDWGWAALSTGPGFTHTVNRPRDPAAPIKSNAWSLVTSSDGALQRGDWQLDWWASYGAANAQYGGRLGLSRRVLADLRLGVEADVSGNRQYRASGGGPTVSWSLPQAGTLELGLGPYRDGDRTGGFVSVGYSRGF